MAKKKADPFTKAAEVKGGKDANKELRRKGKDKPKAKKK